MGEKFGEVMRSNLHERGVHLHAKEQKILLGKKTKNLKNEHSGQRLSLLDSI